jgi:two-component system, OmpR family, osmolarity sensor histidine kinase EnvZ
MDLLRHIFAIFMSLFTGLFWRTFVMISFLLLTSLLTWYFTSQHVEMEPRINQAAAQVQTLVNMTRMGLVHADPLLREALIGDLRVNENISIFARGVNDVVTPLEDSEFNRRLTKQALLLLGKDTVLAGDVNKTDPGLWVSFAFEGDKKNNNYWLQVQRNRIVPDNDPKWAAWGLAALGMSILGAIFITRIINSPLKRLSFAASRIREGDFKHELTEVGASPEIRDLNRGFNRMARSLEKVEQDRAVMLAGISHDIRTPLTRLRLETEMAVPDSMSRQNMIADIEQVNVIIEKFLEYARPSNKSKLVPVHVRELIDDMTAEYLDDDHISLRTKGSMSATVMGDPVELRRALVNLLENAKRYARSEKTDVAEVDVHVRSSSTHIQLEIRDHGPGVPDEHLPNLTKPFFRGDAARTEVKGTGLGLAIVERIIERMDGRFSLTNASPPGLSAKIDLKRA